MRPTVLRRAAYEVFSRSAKTSQRSRAALNVGESRQVDYLRRELAARTVDRLSVIKREFPEIVDFGAGAGYIEQEMCQDNESASIVYERQKNSHFTLVETSEHLLNRDIDEPFNSKLDITRINEDEETFHPGANIVDAVFTSGSMHWINDLPGVLKNINTMLKPDGLFLGNMVGGDSLFELRTSLQLAEMERHGRASPRLSPLAGASDVGNLMQQANFKLLTIDVEDIIVDYPDSFALIEDLRSMGENNAVKMRPNSVSRELLLAANAIYHEMHGNPDGTIPATFRIVHMVGWKHSDNQSKPIKRGSGKINMKDIGPLADMAEDEANSRNQKK